MDKIAESKKCPMFSFQSTNEDLRKLSDLKGQKVVLYFYPRDNTPGCTSEALDFKSKLRSFKNQNAVILGVSRDSLKSHFKFIEKYKLPFDLISDEDENICNLFDVIKEKNMYGKKVMGIERSTFIIDEKGVIIKIWRKVKVVDHVQDVLAELKSI